MSIRKRFNSLDILKSRIAAEDQKKLQERDAKIESDYKIIKENTDYLNLKTKSTKVANQAVYKAEAINAIRARLLENCIYVIAKEAYGDSNSILKTLAATYISENGGAVAVHNRFRYSSELLSEFALKVDKYMERVIKESEESNSDEDDDAVKYKIDPETEDEFCEEIADSDIEDIVEIIKQRVEDALEEFISKNAADKEKLKEIIDRAQEKIEGIKNESVAEAYIRDAKRAMHQVKSKDPIGLFEAVVNNLSKEAIVNPENSVFVTEGVLDVEVVIEKAAIMYTFLETLNTAKIENIDEVFIKDVYEGKR